ncbi:hypothetical protein ALC60_13523 [Trachymyrmex zeteki]|uniref:Chitin-binding type-4 domain-containing protein n=1 Tax=Mycetomoellerius zeteki TaxID=64791 RepID=A0A151WHU5_9HYME|nr:hypothetical protein ALC60_13523 [Trachymyrmex zeteki]
MPNGPRDRGFSSFQPLIIPTIQRAELSSQVTTYNPFRKSALDVHSHGRLMDPPSRNAMWRFGYPNPVNYNDNELFCGGYAVHWEQNKGKCGVCGDAYHSNRRPHEAGGEFANGIIVRHYTLGQEIEVEIELTANHYGRFEIYICPNNDPSREATQECFDSYPLYVSGTQDVRFEIPHDTGKKGIIKYMVTLPPYITCSQCVVQWNYYTGYKILSHITLPVSSSYVAPKAISYHVCFTIIGNMWGTCENGTEAVGCGKPETFRNCADVSIVTSTGGIPPRFLYQNILYELYSIGPKYSTAPLARPLRVQVCEPTAAYRYRQNMTNWCQVNCIRIPSNCPPGVCHCLNTCDAIGDIADKSGADQYCLRRCMRYPSNCPIDRCNCY